MARSAITPVDKRRPTRILDDWGLTPRQRKFADMVLDQPETPLWTIYKECGYKRLGPNEPAQEVKKPKIKAYILAHRRKLAKARNVHRKDLVQALSHIAFFDPIELFDETGTLKPIEQIPEHARKAISSIEVKSVMVGHGSKRKQIGTDTKIRFVDKKGAIDSLARMFGWFEDEARTADGIEGLMRMIGEARGGSTIGRLDHGQRSIDRPALEVEQPLLDPGQEGAEGAVPAELGADAAGGEVLVSERRVEGEAARVYDSSGHLVVGQRRLLPGHPLRDHRPHEGGREGHLPDEGEVPVRASSGSDQEPPGAESGLDE